MRTITLFVSSLALVSGGCDSSKKAPEPAPQVTPPAPPLEAKSPASAETPRAPFSKPPSEALPNSAALKPLSPLKLSFDKDEADLGPKGFSFERTGKGPPGRWVVKAIEGAPSGKNVLAQLSSDPIYFRFPLAIFEESHLKDQSLSVSCKAFWGRLDQVCGLVARFQDPDNYYVARSNALENNVRLYLLKGGERTELAGWNGKVKADDWHKLRFDLHADHLEVYWNDRKVIDYRDSTFTGAGKVGLWTKADSNSYFDDLQITPN